MVKPAWDQAPQGRGARIRLHQKLKCLKEHLKEWTKSTFGNVSQIKEDLLQKFQEIDFTEAEEDLSNLVRNERSRIKEEFTEITAREEIKWRQKARLKWLQEGDNNTKFFHSFANARNLTNWISALNINWSYREDPTKIEEEIIQFFKDVYSRKWVIEGWFSSWSGKPLTNQEAAQLEWPFSVEEINKLSSHVAG